MAPGSLPGSGRLLNYRAVPPPYPAPLPPEPTEEDQNPPPVGESAPSPEDHQAPPPEPEPEIHREALYRGEPGEGRVSSGTLFLVMLLGCAWVLGVGVISVRIAMDEVVPALADAWQRGSPWLLAHGLFDAVGTFVAFLLFSIPGLGVVFIARTS